MLRVTLRNLLARKVRLILSAFAIVLGVAFVSGSLVFTDTMSRSFDSIIDGALSDTNVRPIGAKPVALETVFNFEDRVVPTEVVSQLRKTKGLARLDGWVQGSGLTVVKKDGKYLGGLEAPTIAFNYNDAPNTRGETMIGFSAGHAPLNADQVALDADAAAEAGYELGDMVTMITSGDDARFKAKLVGLATFVGGGVAGATLVYFDTQTARDLFLDGQDAYSYIGMIAKPGVSSEQLTSAARQVIPDGFEAITTEQMVQESKSLANMALKFLSTFLLVFAAIALVVGTFLIINTFSILVAQRSRELALLRAMGASRWQVSRMVLLEAFVVGLIGSTLGLIGGYGLAAALAQLFGHFGLDFSATPLRIQPRIVAASYAVGILVTLFAAYLPARRAARVPPVAALRDDVAMPESSIQGRVTIGVMLVTDGAAMIVLALFTAVNQTWEASLIGAGIFSLLVAVALLSPVIGRPLLQTVGVGYRLAFGAVGNLATKNSLRNPRRTAATAVALMIGITLVTTMTVLGASLNKSMEITAKADFTTDFVVSNPTGQPFSTSINEDVSQVDGVGDISQQQRTIFTIDGSTVYGTAADSMTLSSVFDLEYLHGSAGLNAGEIALDDRAAERFGASVGDTLTLEFASGNLSAQVKGIFEDKSGVGSALIPFKTVTDAGLKRSDTAIRLDAAEGVDKIALRNRIDQVIERFPTVTIQDQEDFIDGQRSQINRILYLIYALLGLAVIIAILGIVNTLALSVVERTREVGLLRAVGLGRRQVRRMVRLEAVGIAVLGAALGITAGVVFGVVLQQSVKDRGIANLSIPWTQLGLFIVVAAVVGILAAVLPALRSARLNVLNAIATE